MTMTMIDVDAVIDRADKDASVAMFKEMPESERRRLAPTVIAHCRKLDRLRMDYEKPNAQREVLWKQFDTAALALYATATLSEINDLGVRTLWDERLHGILAARCSAWLEAWAGWTLEANGGSWRVIRRLVREGVCKRPETDPNYYL